MISSNGHDENGKYHSGKAGDQTGTEYRVRTWYNFGQKCILRHPNTDVQKEIAYQAEAAANNNHCGYDQWERLTFDSALIAANNDPAKIAIDCEADCSSSTAAIIRSAGRKLSIDDLMLVDRNLTTFNMRAALIKAGFAVYTDSKFLSSDNYLLPGDIVLNDDKHVVINLTKGSKIQNEPTREEKLMALNKKNQENVKRARENAKVEKTEAAAPAETTPKTYKYKVNADPYLNVRASKSTTSAIIDEIDNGSEIEILYIEQGWAKLVGNGYVSANFISKVE